MGRCSAIKFCPLLYCESTYSLSDVLVFIVVRVASSLLELDIHLRCCIH